MHAVSTIRCCIIGCSAWLLAIASPAWGSYAVVQTLYSFGSGDGAPSGGSLVFGQDGNLYGTVQIVNGPVPRSFVYKLSTSGVRLPFSAMFDPDRPPALSVGLTLGPDGNFYGVDGNGGDVGIGDIFRLDSGGGVTPIHSFPASTGQMTGELVLAGDGKLYGMTHGDFSALGCGGSSYGCGTYFSITTGGAFTLLYDFVDGGSNPSSTAGWSPQGKLLLGADGALYGGTAGGGNADCYVSGSPIDVGLCGTLFRIAPGGGFATTYFFGSPNDPPAGGLQQDSDGNLYGATFYGHTFRFSSSGEFAYLPNPQGNFYPLGLNPTGISKGADGNFYFGMQFSGGCRCTSIFQITPPGTVANLYTFPDGVQLAAGPMVLGSDGALYGTTINGGANGMGSVFSMKLYPIAPPGVAAQPGDGRVTLSWNAPSGATSYDVYQGNSPGGESATPVLSGVTTTSTTISGLGNGTSYYFYVVAKGANGASPPSTEVSATPHIPPVAPTGVTAQPGNGQIRVCWNPSAGAVSYTLYRVSGTSGAGKAGVASGIKGGCYTVTGLVNGTTYYFEVTAYAFGQESAPSSVLMATLPAASSSPSALTSMTAYPGDGQATLCWSGAVTAYSYNLYSLSAPGGSGVLLASGIAGGCYTVTGLSNGTTYYYRVTGVNGFGEGAPSPVVTVTLPLAATAPSAPAAVIAIAGSGTARICWSGVAAAYSYNLYQLATPAGTPGLVAAGIRGGSYTLGGLSNGTTYYFEVTALNKAGASSFSPLVSVTPGP